MILQFFFKRFILLTPAWIITVFIASMAFGSDPTLKREKPPGPIRDNSDKVSDVPSTFLQGIVKPRRNAVLRFSAAGIVTNVHVKEGDFVRQGDPLLTTDDRLERAALELAELDLSANSALKKANLDLELALIRYQRIEEAAKRKAATKTEVLEKKHAFEAARWTYQQQIESQRRLSVQLEIAKVNLANKTLRAPFDGQVMRLHHQLGNSVDFSTAAVVCSDLSILTVEMNLPSELYGKIDVGTTRLLKAMTPVSRNISAKVTHIASEIEPSSKTFRVTFEIENHDLKLPSGFEVWFAEQRKLAFSSAKK